MYRIMAIALTAIILLRLGTYSTHLQVHDHLLGTESAAATSWYTILSLSQAQNVTTLTELIRAYNAGHLDDVLALLDEKVVWSDCDYQNIKVVNLVGKGKVAEWLKERFVDHDFLEIGTIQTATMEIQDRDPVTKDAVGVDYQYRTSDTLKNLGFPKGIKPQLASKVIFTATHDHVLRFANGPYGGSVEACRPY